MIDELLPYYDSELRYMRELAGEFAEAHPKIAGHLRMSKEAIADPHVARLIEAFAFLNARVRMKLDDMFPELTESILGVLYPHFLAPIPSMAIAEFDPDPSLDGSASVPAHEAVTTEPIRGEACTYRTGYDVDIWPIRVESAQVFARPLPAPDNPRAPGAAACLRLRLECLSPEGTFTGLGLDRLRVFLFGEPRLQNILYELMTNNAVSIALADDQHDPAPVFLPPSALRPVGMESGDALLPGPRHASHAYSLLTEYFAFPEKFAFIDIENLSAKTLRNAGRAFDIYIYFDHAPDGLERLVSKENFRLFCTPVVNLFKRAADPIRLDHTKTEYRVSPDARREDSMEVYAVEKVGVGRKDGSTAPYRPFFSMERSEEDSDRFWSAARRKSPHAGGGDDVFLSFSDLEGLDEPDAGLVASIDILCTNRDLPAKLPFGGGHPKLALVEANAAAKAMRCLTPPTRTLRPKRGRDAYWRLVSQLTLNHLSISDGSAGAAALKESLTLYDHHRSPETRAVLDKLKSIHTTPSVSRAPGGGRVAFCSGMDVTLELDDERFSGSGTFLLASVLERFLANYCAVNSFTRLSVVLSNEKGTYRRWPARSGSLALV